MADAIALLVSAVVSQYAVAGRGLAVALLGVAAWLLAARATGLYTREHERIDDSTADEIAQIFILTTVVAWLLALATAAIPDAAPPLAHVALFWALAVVLIPVTRGAWRTVRPRGSPARRTIVVGAGDIGQLVGRKLLQHPEYGLEVLGFVDAEPKERRPDLGELTLLGAADELDGIVRDLAVERAVLAFSRDATPRTVELARRLLAAGITVDVVPRLFDVVHPGSRLDAIEGLSVLSVPAPRRTRSALFAKRVVDLAGASLALLLASPLMAYIAWRVRRDSPGPVLFRQTRLGMGMREFTALKFRTMEITAATAPHREYIAESMARSLAPERSGLFKLDRADAFTPSGRWLRRTSLDELPQLLNVLRGDMSLVGPRPCIPYEVEHFEPHHFERFAVPAGLTGLWQVTARGRCSFREALELDVAYARGRSLGLDLRLLLKTPGPLLRGEAAL